MSSSGDTGKWPKKEFKTQTIEESAHWISFNVKALVSELKSVTNLLADIRDEMRDKRYSTPRINEREF